MTALLKAEGIRKTYPGVVANNGIDIEIRPGEVHAVLGENGAGKSTLMNILYGMTQPDAGRILWKGREVHIASPRMAMDLGIGMVHQHFMLVPTLTVVENVILGTRPRALLELKGAAERVASLSRRFGLEVDPWAVVDDLPVGLKQRVEIVKALFRGAEVLILDEPTAVLTPDEVRELFTVVRRLTGQGRAVVFISHKLDELLEISDRITVLRDGRVAGTVWARETTKEELAVLMVGREVSLQIPKRPVPLGAPVLRVEELCVAGRPGGKELRGISLEVRAGEILGLAGVDGNGQRELAEAIFGLVPVTGGRILVGGREITGCPPRKLIAGRVGRIPEDRHRMGLALEMSVEENLLLGAFYRPPFARRGFLNLPAMREAAAKLIAEYGIRTPGAAARVATLSGGNQQKVILARELALDPVLLVVMNPVRGLDIGATEYVYRQLLARRERGTATLLISSDLEEILSLCDRIAVIHDGRIMGVVPADAADRARIGLMMGGTAL